MLTVGVVAASSAIVVAAAIVQRAVGFGFALFAVPLMAFVLPTKSAVVVVFLIGSLTSIWVALHLRSSIDWSMTRWLGAGAVVGAPFGVIVLALVSADVLRLVLGLATCTAAIWILVSSRLARAHTARPNRGGTFTVGVASGIINTSLATNGPPLVYELRRNGFRDDRFRATISAVFVLSNLIGLPLLVTAGLVHGSDVALAATTLVPCVVGMAIGGWLGARMEPAHFVWSVDILLLATGLLTIVKALS
jgi:uncharacterized protein